MRNSAQNIILSPQSSQPRGKDRRGDRLGVMSSDGHEVVVLWEPRAGGQGSFPKEEPLCTESERMCWREPGEGLSGKGIRGRESAR